VFSTQYTAVQVLCQYVPIPIAVQALDVQVAACERAEGREQRADVDRGYRGCRAEGRGQWTEDRSVWRHVCMEIGAVR
jgi:hypothetical protein